MIRTHNAVTQEEHSKILTEERNFSIKNKDATNNDLIEYLIICAESLGRPPKRQEVVGFMLIKSRFGPWPRVLEKAGLKKSSTLNRKSRKRRNIKS